MNSPPQSLGDILKKFDPLRDKYVSREFQKYGYDLAMELGDPDHKALYIKLAKEVPRPILEKARYFVKDAKAKSKARLFMWKLQKLRKSAGKNQDDSPNREK
ncbi:MAG TPA: hypothetical protein VMW04_04650 [Patescibacteria group bacterium]|nr:hypothetical protein [Patescibacteria group bacterium]